VRKLYEICYGIEPTEREIALLEIQYKRLQDNGFTNKEAKQLMIDNKFRTDDLLFDDSIITTSDDTVYYHYELQIHSKPGGFDPETCTVIKQPYYLEMRYRYTMDALLEYYYNKLLVPIMFRDVKRDSGAFNHMICTYKFETIKPVDFLLFLIDYAVSIKYKTSNPLDLKNLAQETYEYLESNILCYKPVIKYREELINE
jgi:hypothetical protein